jgi:hypothetical protein
METPESGTILGAPAGAGCPTTYNYTSSEAGSAGYTYNWSYTAPGGCYATIATPYNESTNITFVNTTGYNQIFTLYLDITSECCGPLEQVVRYITIWPAPLNPTVTDASPSICTGGSQTLSVNSPAAGTAYNWYDVSSGGSAIGAGSSYVVSPVASGTDYFYVDATNSYGCTSDRTEIVLTGTDTPPPAVTTPVAVCGSNDAVLSITGPTAGYIYNWYSGSCAPTGTLLQTSTSSVYTTVVSSDISIYVSQTPPGCGPSTCATIALDHSPAPDPIYWLGTNGGLNNWFNNSNWTNGCLPTCETNVVIPDGTPFDPDIGFSSAGEAETNNINLNSGVTLSFSDVKAVLSICGNFIHAGTVSTGNLGKIVFNGSTSVQSYQRTGSGDLNSVKIANSYSDARVTLSSDMVLGTAGVLEFQSGKLETGTYKVVVNNTASSSVIGHSEFSYINGNIRRYISTDASNYFHFPVGTASYYEYSGLKIKEQTNTGSPYIDAKFTNPHTGTTLGAITLFGTPITVMLDYGFWTFTPTNVSTINYDVTLTSRGHTNGGSDPAMHTIVKRDNSATAWATYESNHSNSTQTGTGTNPITAVLTNMTSFSDKAIARSEVILPIDLVAFDYKCLKNKILISWSTAMEVNNEHFILQRSFDGNVFETIAIIDGAGSSVGINDYSFADYVEYNGDIIYKLLQKDIDGVVKTTGFANANCSKNEANISIFSPFNEEFITIVFQKPGVYNAMLYDQIGRKLFEKSINTTDKNASITIEKSQFSYGIYNLIIRSSGESFFRQIVISSYK